MQCLAYQTKFRLGSSFIRLGNAHKVLLIFVILIFKLGKKSVYGKKIFWDFDNIPFCPKIDFRQNTSQESIKIFFFSRNEFRAPKYIIPPNFIDFGF
jgi:hypothetical protein